MSTSEGLTYAGLDRKGMTGNPQPCNTPLIAPYCTLSKNCQTKAVTTTGTIEGKKKIDRKIERPGIFVLSSSAIKNAEMTPSGLLMSTHHIVLYITVRKSASLVSNRL